MKSLRSPFVPIVLAILALAVSAVCDLAAPRDGVFQFHGGGETGLSRLTFGEGPVGIAVTSTSSAGLQVRLADDSAYAPAEAAAVTLSIIPNPFALETLFAQPNRAAINVVAPYRVTMGVAAAQITTSGNVNGGVCLKALVPGQTLYIGVSSAVTTSTGWPMTDNESLCLEVRNANVLYGIASAAAQSVAVLPFSRF